MVYSPTFNRDVRLGTSSAVLLQDFPADKDISVEVVNLVAEDGVASRGLLYHRAGQTSSVAAQLCHPKWDQSQSYVAVALASAGIDVLARMTRWPNNDTQTIHEELLLDMAAGVTFLRKTGYDNVVLVGNSGGGALASLYQEQAETQPPGRLTTTAAGDDFDLNAYSMPPASGLVLLAAHRGQGMIMLRDIDPSVIDEHDPLSCNPSLDMYRAGNGYQRPPEASKYSEDFLAAYRNAQRARVERLDAYARARVEQQRASRRAVETTALDSDAAVMLARQSAAGWHMIVYRTSANPEFVDLSLEPNDRLLGSTTGAADPERENYGQSGLGRCVTPRAWLSTWSGLSSRANTADCLNGVRIPTLIVHYAGDNGTTVADAETILKAAQAADKQLVLIGSTEHYGFRIVNGERSRERSTEGTDAVVAWIKERFSGRAA
jgi:pimeloyl-ACP methyl ester carboxylesterase